MFFRDIGILAKYVKGYGTNNKIWEQQQNMGAATKKTTSPNGATTKMNKQQQNHRFKAIFLDYQILIFSLYYKLKNFIETKQVCPLSRTFIYSKICLKQSLSKRPKCFSRPIIA